MSMNDSKLKKVMITTAQAEHMTIISTSIAHR